MFSIHTKTPLIFSEYYSNLADTNIYLKLENLQPTGSFKARGIGALCDHYIREGKQALVASSGGNAGIAVAYSAKKLGVEARIFVPNTTPRTAINKMKFFGAKVEISGDVWDEADAKANETAKSIGAGYVPPFDHPVIWEGHSSIIEEIADELTPDAIVCSVGGGGLLCGILRGCEKLGLSDVTMITSETEGAASFHNSYIEKKVVYLDKINTIAGTLGAKHITSALIPYFSKYKFESFTVSDEQALSGAVDFANYHRMIVEPACGAALALCDIYKDKLKKYKNIVVIVCGGCCVGLVNKSIATL